MKVILLQDIPKVGKKFEVKMVSDGYAINFLLPHRLAELATGQAMRRTASQKEKYEQEKTTEINKLKDILSQLEGKLIIPVKTNTAGRLFAGIDKKEIAKIIQEKTGMKIDSNLLELDKPLKEIGEHLLKIKLGGETGQLTLLLKAE